MSILQALSPEQLAEQLRHPTGADGVAVADALEAINGQGNASIVASLQLGCDDQVLEVGCGLATMAQAVADAADRTHYTGLDQSKTIIDAAAHRYADLVRAGRAAFVRAEVEQLPMDDALFTKVFSTGVIHFWADPVRALREVRRVMRPGGLMVMGGLGPAGALPFARPEYGFFLRDERQWEGHCRDAGFPNVEVQSPDTPGPQTIVLFART